MSAFYPFLQVKQNGRRTGTQPDSTTPLADITHLVNDRFAPEAVIRALAISAKARRLASCDDPGWVEGATPPARLGSEERTRRATGRRMRPDGRGMRRIVFSIAFFRKKLPAQSTPTSTKSRWKFYRQVGRRSFHTAWTQTGPKDCPETIRGTASQTLIRGFRTSAPVDRAQRQRQRHHHHGDHA
jgi:hypothetical protein